MCELERSAICFNVYPVSSCGSVYVPKNCVVEIINKLKKHSKIVAVNNENTEQGQIIANETKTALDSISNDNPTHNESNTFCMVS